MKVSPLAAFRSAALILLVLAGLGLHWLSPFPRRDLAPPLIPLRAEIRTPNRFEVQGPNQCGGYATAFVLRHLGREASGADIYRRLGRKLPFSGYVLPGGITRLLEREGFRPALYRGTLRSLKAHVAKGRPPIVLVGDSVDWQHYITLVGYNTPKRALYFYDSNYTHDANGPLPGNRTLTEKEFLSLWNNGLPGFSRIYVVAYPEKP